MEYGLPLSFLAFNEPCKDDESQAVCLIYQLLQQHAAGLLLWARHTRDINQLLHSWCSAATVSSVTLSADAGS